MCNSSTSTHRKRCTYMYNTNCTEISCRVKLVEVAKQADTITNMLRKNNFKIDNMVESFKNHMAYIMSQYYNKKYTNHEANVQLEKGLQFLKTQALLMMTE